MQNSIAFKTNNILNRLQNYNAVRLEGFLSIADAAGPTSSDKVYRTSLGYITRVGTDGKIHKHKLHLCFDTYRSRLRDISRYMNGSEKINRPMKLQFRKRSFPVDGSSNPASEVAAERTLGSPRRRPIIRIKIPTSNN